MMRNLSTFGYGWRFLLIDHLKKSNSSNCGIYQFGVWDGFSLQVLFNFYNRIKPNDELLFLGFDVFTGMPAETVEPDKQIDEVGSFNLLKEYNVDNVEDAVTLLNEDLSKFLVPKHQLGLYQGLVEDTLDKFDVNTLPKALYVDMDLDIYSPTLYTLDFLFKNNIVGNGTIIGYDDWGQNYPQVPTYSSGESRAHKEIMEKYNVECEQLLITPENQQVAFKIISIGENNE
jgi:hypothetical protein